VVQVVVCLPRKLETLHSKHIRITSDLSAPTLKARKAWDNIIHTLRENNCQPRIVLYPAKLSFNLGGEIRTIRTRKN
jgi:hypothetical protein